MPRFNRSHKKRSKKNKNNAEKTDLSLFSQSLVRNEMFQKTQWNVREVRGKADEKNYICPGCNQTISAKNPHVVVWPDNAIMGEAWAISQRRHWHSGCWKHRKYGG